MRRALEGPGVPEVDAESMVWQWLGPGNTNMRPDGWVGEGYYPPGVLPLPTQPRYPPVVHPMPAPRVPALTPRTGVFRSTKEILGVDNAHVEPGVSLGPARTALRRPRASPGAALWGLLQCWTGLA